MPETHHTGWKENPWFDIVKCYVTWHLSDCVTNSKDGVDLVELVPVKCKLFFHTTHVRVVKVGSIQVIQKIHEAAKGEDEEV